MEKFRKKFEGGVFSTQGKLIINSGDLLCHVSQINEIKGENSFGKPFIELITEQNLHWEYSHSMDKIPKIDFFDYDFPHVRREFWDIMKKSPSEKWLIISNDSLTNVSDLLPNDWEEDAYPNVKIALINYSTVPDYILPKNFIGVTSNGNEMNDTFEILFENLDRSTVPSCLWIVSGIAIPKLFFKY